MVNKMWLFVVFDAVTVPLVVSAWRAARTCAGDAIGLAWR